MIVVDTSVWIHFFRVKDPVLVARLKELLDEDQVSLALPVRFEILSGTPRQELQRMGRLLNALPLLYPTEETWIRMEEWISLGLNRGERFGVLDLMIAAITHQHQASLWSLDNDFARMQKLGWIRLL